jgi:hypothetical protein
VACSATAAVSPAATSVVYQWFVGGVAVSGATKASYTPVASDAGKAVSVRVTASKAGYTAATVTSASKTVAAATVVIGSVNVSGTAKTDQTLTADVSGVSPSDATLAYQWLLGGVAVSGATAKTYTVKAADVGKAVSVRVTASKTGHTTATVTSASKTVAAATFAYVSPTVCASPKVDAACSATVTVSPAATATYQWLVGGVAVPGATKASYTPVASDAGKAVSVRVTASKTGYTAATVTSASKTVVGADFTSVSAWICDSPTVGKACAATVKSSPAATKTTYQWFVAGVAVSGATKSSYTPVKADAGKALYAKVTLARDGYVTTTVVASKKTG